MNDKDFSKLIALKGRELYRTMPWREDTNPYFVLVSELMLQQTQVARVVPKFEAFIRQFPDVLTLANASLGDVLRLWQGLGYNRRAKFLHEASKIIVEDYGQVFPSDEHELMKLPGVGKNTSGAICAYAFNRPAIFVETNIRTVYIHHFFIDGTNVDDNQIINKLNSTINIEHPREFYWALMDYGSWLKSQGIRNNANSKHYTKQTPLKGSVREMRGEIIRVLVSRNIRYVQLQKLYSDRSTFAPAYNALINENIITQTDGTIHLTK